MNAVVICLILSSIGLLLFFLQFAATWSVVRKGCCGDDRKKEDPTGFPPVSILKPLKGLDDNLFDNLASFCQQDYPSYELILSLQDWNDKACKVAMTVKRKYPQVNITVLVEKCNVGLNPKVNNLIPAYSVAAHSYILISDSNVMVGKDYLKTIMDRARDPEVGLVTNLVQGTGGRTLGSVFENLHLNSFILGSVCFLDRVLRMPCVIGKSMLMKKADLDALGGLAKFKDVLAEDYIIGREMHRAGKKVVLSNYRISNVNEFWDIRRFLNRHARWGKLRWSIGGGAYLSELLANPVFIASLPVLFRGPSLQTLSLVLAVSIVKAVGDAAIGKILGSSGTVPGLKRIPVTAYLLSPAKDILIGILWFAPLISSTVVWRGSRYLIGKDSRLSPCPQTGFRSWGYRLTDTLRTRFA